MRDCGVYRGRVTVRRRDAAAEQQPDDRPCTMPTGSPSAAAAAAATPPTGAATTPPSGGGVTALPPSSGGGGGGGGGQARLSQTNLYIRGLSPDTTDKDLVSLCQPSVIRSRAFQFGQKKCRFDSISILATESIFSIRFDSAI